MRILHYTNEMEKPNAKQQPSVGHPPPTSTPAEVAPDAASEPQSSAEMSPADTSEQMDGESLEAWIERASRLHELVDAVDLEKVAAHDASEVAKVSNVTQALDALSEGGAINRVEGVDEVVPELNARHQQLAELVEQLTAAGWGERLGRVLNVGPEGETLKPMDIIPHQEGLPEYDVCVAPRESVGSGYFALMISATAVFAAAVNEPPSRHHWRVYRSRPYDNHEEMLHVVKQFSRTAFE